MKDIDITLRYVRSDYDSDPMYKYAAICKHGHMDYFESRPHIDESCGIWVTEGVGKSMSFCRLPPYVPYDWRNSLGILED